MSARVGLIIPSSNRMVEQEMVHAFPRRRHTAHHAAAHDRARTAWDMTSSSRGSRKRRARSPTPSATWWRSTAPRIRWRKGRAARRASSPRSQGSGARHATTTATAIRRALDALGARKIVLVTPYSQAVTDHEAEFLNDAGYDVIYAKGYELAGSDAYCATPPRGLARPRARGGASGRRRLFPELRQYFGVRHHRGSGSATRPSGHHQQPDRDLGRARAARMERPPRLPGTIVRSRRRCGGGAGGATCVGGSDRGVER